MREGSGLTGERALRLFDAQLASRHLDLAARWLRSFGEGFYTIGSGIAPECYSTPNHAAVNMGPRYSVDGATQ